MNPAAWPLVHTKRLLYIFTSLTWRLSLGEVAWGRIWKWTHLKKWVMGDGSSCQFLQLEAYFDNFSTWFSVRLVSKEGELQDRSLLIVEKRREIASSLNFLPHASPPPSLRTRPGSFDKRYRTLEWRWCSLVSCAAFTLSHQRGSTRLSFLFWFNLALLFSEFFGRQDFLSAFFSWQERRNSGWVGGTPWGRGRIISLMTTLTITNQQLHNKKITHNANTETESLFTSKAWL